MTNSKAPWLTRGGAIALMAAAAIALAACSGGGGLNEDEAAGLRGELEAAQLQATADAAARVTAVAEAALAQTAKETAEAEATVARKAQVAAEAAKKLAEEIADGQVSDAEADVETAQKVAKDALDAKAKADAALIEARAKQKEAEDERDAAIADEKEAQRQLGLAQQETTTEQQRRRKTEADLEQSEQDRDDAQQKVTRADARQVREGLAATIGIADSNVEDPMVTPKSNAAADVSGTDVSFSNSNPTTGSLSGWFKTAFVKSTRDQIDRLEIYSNVEAVKSIRFRDSDYNDGTANDADIPNTTVVGRYDGTVVDHDDNVGNPNVVISPEGMIINWLSIPADIGRKDAVASPFPRESGTESYTLNDRGINEADFLGIVNNLVDNNGDEIVDRDDMRRLLEGYTDDNDMVMKGYSDDLLDETAAGLDITRQELSRYIRGASFRNTKSYPQRYEYETRGSLGGASGTFRCGGDTQVTCSVKRTGSELEFPAPGLGTWTFRPSSASESVRVEDSEYMYFGWWSRQNTGTGSWEFKAFHGPGGTDGHRVTDVTGVTGSAEYQGPAAGYYAIYEPASAGSEHGAFTATATLTADFDANPNTVSGTIDQFSGHPDWSLSLESGDIADIESYAGVDDVDDGVIWTIGDDPAAAGGSWEANFYSNLASGDRDSDLVPSGIAGTFRATYDQVGHLIGAFGAECETGC